MTNTILSNYNLINYLLKTIPRYINDNISIKLTDDTVTINTSHEHLVSLVNFLKNHYKLQYKTLIGITAVDFPEKENRFKLFYFLLSYKLNSRIIITIDTSDVKPLDSITSIYAGANWYEREVWDMFGVIFNNHPDLRRILTDYGFEGFPLRKDFPQTGFVEVRYDDEKKHVLYEPLEITQEFRSFDFLNPWSNLK